MASKKSDVEQMIDRTDAEVTAAERNDSPDAVQDAPQPVYKKFKDARIPISKHAGALWKSRHDTGLARLRNSGSIDAWEETIRYYKNDQTGKRNRDNPDQPSSGSAKSITASGDFAQTENVVFSNVSALVPSVYAKNPDLTVYSPKGDQDKDFTICAQKLVRTIMQKRTAPGINLKPKMRRATVMTTLTNIAYIEVGYTQKEQASEPALEEIDRIAAELEHAKDQSKIIELEGQLAALDDKIDLLQPAGPWAQMRHPKDVIIDPDASMSDGSDAKWIMIRDVFETSFLNAVYRTKDENGNWTSIFKPSHVIAAGEGGRNIAGHDTEITNFNLLQASDDDPNKYGYGDDVATYKRAQRTYVWKIWDRITRRVYWYAENDWAWPIWVWDDPYGFDDFFPIFPLAFHTDPEDMHARGEVSYYLDQQDEINKINSQVAMMRHRVSKTLIYNKRIIKNDQDLAALTKNVDGDQLVGIELPEGTKMEEAIMAPPIPATDFAQLFDKQQLYGAVDRSSGVPMISRNVEFRTNTTNKAIDSYESSSSMRLDEKIDAIEEIIGRIGYAVLFMCLQFMPKEQVVELIGTEHAQAWPPNMSAAEARKAFTLTVTGGSSLKPTSKVRKEQAKEAAQIIGQFGASNPLAFFVVLKMFQRAFSDELVLEPQDWDMLVGSIEQQLQGQQQEQQQPKGEGGEQGAAAPDVVKQIDEMLAKMPPELRAKVGGDIAKGEPVSNILKKLQTVAQQRGAQQQPQHPRPQ